MPDDLLLVVAGLFIVAAIVILLWWVRASWRESPARQAVARTLAARGPARCVAAAHLLEDLAGLADQPAIAEAWDEIELPLLQALPDCPPELKPELVSALATCAGVCTNRELAKRLMTMRNSLLG